MKRVLILFIVIIQSFYCFAGPNTVFPNPAQSSFSIKSAFQIKQVEIYDFLGTKIKSFQNKKEPTNYFKISTLSPGRYFVKVYYQTGKHEIKILIKK